MSLNDYCRLCLVDLTDTALGENGHSIINESTMDDQPLQLVIQECFQISLTSHETIDKICCNCYNDVQVVKKIRMKVHETDVAIKNYYSKLEIKYDVEYLVEDQDVPLMHVNDVSVETLPLELKSELQNISDDDNEGKGLQNDNEGICLQKSDMIEDDHLKAYEFIEIGETSIVEVAQNEPEISKVECIQEDKSKPKKLNRRMTNAEETRKHNKFTCYICTTDFDNIEELDEHLPSHVGSIASNCHLCNVEVTTVRHFNMHLQRIHFRKGKRIPCLECQKENKLREFSSNYKLQEHIRRVHQGIVEIAERRFVCTYCGKNFTRGTHLRLHENIHTKSVIFKCKYCTNFTATSRSSLLRHERVHTSEKPFKCDMCDASFAQSNGLQSHKTTRHNDDRPFVCEICGENARFKSKYTLRIHMRIHENTESGRKRRMRYDGTEKSIQDDEIEKPITERELKCNFCPAVYYKERFLCRHIIDKHPTENIPMIPCEICNEQDKVVFFLSQKEKDDHMNHHPKTKPAVPQKTRTCKDCGESFQNADSLARHRQSHSSNKCNKCGKVYKKRSTLRLHYLTVHYESRPFKCDKCDASYGQLTQLTAHMKKHD